MTFVTVPENDIVSVTRTVIWVSASHRKCIECFSFDLGSGTLTLKSKETVTLNRVHRVRAQRFGKEGLLKLDDETEVAGLSRGTLKSLNLMLPVYLGYVPHMNKE